MLNLLTLALAVYGVAAVPFSERGSTLDDAACVASIPAGADPATVDKVYLAAVNRGVSLKVLQATLETCLQETRCNNLNCGDQDSLGAFQQRPSMGWGTAAQVQDPTYAAGKFLDQAIPMAAQNPGWSPDQIAQGVQRAELGNLYAKQFDWANQLISQAEQRTGKKLGGGGGSPAPAPPSGGGGGCSNSVTVNGGDSCWAISQAHGISVADIISKNPGVNSGCTNLKVGQQLCLGGSSGGGGGGSGCSSQVTVNGGDSCWAISQAHGVSVSDILSKNSAINSGCTNLKVGQSICL